MGKTLLFAAAGALACAFLVWPSTARADGDGCEEFTGDFFYEIACMGMPEPRVGERKRHMFGVHGGFGAARQIGVRYLAATETGLGRGFESTGHGPELRAVAGDDGVDALGLHWLVRYSFWAAGFGSAAELGLGLSKADESWQGSGELGFFSNVAYVDFGVTLQFPLVPLKRPDWMGTFLASVRFYLPL
ncbi:MAG: hypothetical protein ACOCV2_06300 [Persicimonas sp.]